MNADHEYKCFLCGDTNPENFRDYKTSTVKNRVTILTKCKKHFFCMKTLYADLLGQGLSPKEARKRVEQQGKETYEEHKVRTRNNAQKVKAKVSEDESEDSDSEKSPPEPKPKKVTFTEARIIPKKVIVKNDNEEEDDLHTYLVEKTPKGMSLYMILFPVSNHIPLITSALERIHKVQYITKNGRSMYYASEHNNESFKQRLLQVCLVLDVKPLMMAQVSFL